MQGMIDKQLACCLCASYIGGSVNFAAVAKVGTGSRRTFAGSQPGSSADAFLRVQPEPVMCISISG